MKQLVDESLRTWQSLGHVNYCPTPNEQGSLLHRRSIYVTEDIKKGAVFTHDNIRVIRPGKGHTPTYLQVVIGKHAARNIKKEPP